MDRLRAGAGRRRPHAAQAQGPGPAPFSGGPGPVSARMIAVSPVVRRCHGDRFDRRLSMLMIVNRKHKSLGCRACWLYDGVAHAGTVANTVVAANLDAVALRRPPAEALVLCHGAGHAAERLSFAAEVGDRVGASLGPWRTGSGGLCSARGGVPARAGGWRTGTRPLREAARGGHATGPPGPAPAGPDGRYGMGRPRGRLIERVRRARAAALSRRRSPRRGRTRTRPARGACRRGPRR